MRFLLSSFLSVFLVTTSLFGQSERQETIVIPVSSLGDVSEVRRKILQNTLAEELRVVDLYAMPRKKEYPHWSVQLNKIYDDGIDAWKTDMVDPIKAKYPKP